MRKVPKLLSKTKILRGYRCLKAIYYTIHKPELEPEVTPAQQQIFDQGHEVGEKAREYYPGGVLVDAKAWEFVDALRKTRELLKSGTEHIYEAAFEYRGCYARADILKYNKATERWTLLEVKSTTKLKPEHIEDVGLQAWIIANSGLKLERICVVHLNPECRFPDLQRLFVEVDVTDRLRENYMNIAPRLNSIFGAIRSETVPDIDIGPQCTAHFRDCEFKAACWAERGVPSPSAFDLPKIGEKAWEFYRNGKIRFEDLNVNELNELQKRVVKAHLTDSRFIDKSGLLSAIQSWHRPLIFLDFETINPAIPRHPGCSPYTQVPFQFSVHIWPENSETLEHREFLYDGNDDPRPALIPELLEACAGNGPVLAYYAKFERDCIESLAEFAPEYRTKLLELSQRLIDPLPVIRENIYDPGFGGRFSLKNVAPALLGKDYSYADMAIGDGSAAQRAYLDLLKETSVERREQIRGEMLAYCAKDTLALAETVRWLVGLKD